MQKVGCGCGGTSGAKPCANCSGVLSPGTDSSNDTCAPCVEAAFERPRFFSGQLLTEDDLSALTEYVTAKNRLHNARFYGGGVVCGLDVTCHPCGGGKVIVRPGYALDCCGDDLVLACEREVDILAMIRALRTKLKGGWDCGDPCTDAAAQPAPKPSEGDASKTKDASDNVDRNAREYCLYVRYTETPTDLVAPYPTDTSCGGACEATRILEGVTFELRCPSSRPAPTDIWTRVMECMQMLAGADQKAHDGVVLQARAAQVDFALRHVDDEAVTYDVSEIPAWKDSWSKLRDGIHTIPTTEEGVLERVDLVRVVGALILRYNQLSNKNDKSALRKELGQDFPETAIEAVNDACDQLFPQQQTEGRGRTTLTKKGLVEQYVTSPLERAVAQGIVESYRIYTDDQTQLATFSGRLYTYGGVYERYTAPAYATALQGVRDVTFDRVAGGTSSDCRLAKDVSAITIPSPSNPEKATKDDAHAFVRATDRTIGVLLRALADCICAALNPPCLPCDDPSVLLACITVEDCEVVEICNLVRTFVLTSTAMRYWLPPLAWLGKILETACCSVSDLAASPERAARRIARDPLSAFASQLFGGPSFGVLSGVETAFYGQTLDASLPRVANNLVALASQRAQIVGNRLPSLQKVSG